MTFYVFVNTFVLRRNAQHGTNYPPLRYQKGLHGKPVSATRLRFKGGEVIYNPSGDPALPSGPRLVIATEDEPEIIE